MLMLEDQNLKNFLLLDISFLYTSIKKIKEIKTSFHEEEVGDGLLILETHYFSDICKLQLLCAAAK